MTKTHHRLKSRLREDDWSSEEDPSINDDIFRWYRNSRHPKPLVRTQLQNLDVCKTTPDDHFPIHKSTAPKAIEEIAILANPVNRLPPHRKVPDQQSGLKDLLPQLLDPDDWSYPSTPTGEGISDTDWEWPPYSLDRDSTLESSHRRTNHQKPRPTPKTQRVKKGSKEVNGTLEASKKARELGESTKLLSRQPTGPSSIVANKGGVQKEEWMKPLISLSRRIGPLTAKEVRKLGPQVSLAVSAARSDIMGHRKQRTKEPLPDHLFGYEIQKHPECWDYLCRAWNLVIESGAYESSWFPEQAIIKALGDIETSHPKVQWQSAPTAWPTWWNRQGKLCYWCNRKKNIKEWTRWKLEEEIAESILREKLLNIRPEGQQVSLNRKDNVDHSVNVQAPKHGGMPVASITSQLPGPVPNDALCSPATSLNTGFTNIADRSAKHNSRLSSRARNRRVL